MWQWPAKCERIEDVTVTTGPFARALASAATLKSLADVTGFDVAVVLGSGWHTAADALGPTERSITLSDIPGWPVPTVPGHEGSLRYVRWATCGFLCT